MPTPSTLDPRSERKFVRISRWRVGASETKTARVPDNNGQNSRERAGWSREDEGKGKGVGTLDTRNTGSVEGRSWGCRNSWSTSPLGIRDTAYTLAPTTTARTGIKNIILPVEILASWKDRRDRWKERSEVKVSRDASLQRREAVDRGLP